MTVLSMTDLPVLPILVSCISSQRSFPSRVRSPTPAKTENPLCTLAMRAISSVKMTVLPSPAPPNRPILPPRTNGVSKSTTLIPVSKLLGLGREVSNAGGSRWIGQRSFEFTGPRPSIGSPSRLNTRPSVSLPTGTLTGPPVSITGMPRTRPSVEPRATQRTRLPPRCCCTSPVKSILIPLTSLSTCQGVVDVGQMPFVELGVEGRADHLGNPSVRGRVAMSNPLVRFTHPYVMERIRYYLSARQAAADDLGQLTRDLVLSGAVVLPCQRP